ncbi:hypothetical protein [Yaniella halotolerans]|uniref:hypothetical protein n=1 Tax=Yaniella halotolerans TaxID=225453 RepID=UPI0003B3FC36|nr:hypothetical protein [Yaniella halotolerans]
MLDIVMISIVILLLFNLVMALIVVGRRTNGNGWLLGLLLTGTTGAALAAVMAALFAEELSRFTDLSLVLMGLAALPVVMRVMLIRRADAAPRGACDE